MNEFQRHEDCIIDNKNSMIIDTHNGIIYSFDFSNMTMQISGKKIKKPIRYLDDTKGIRFWHINSWIRLNTKSLSEATILLFNNYNERILLGDLNE